MFFVRKRLSFLRSRAHITFFFTSMTSPTRRWMCTSFTSSMLHLYHFEFMSAWVATSEVNCVFQCLTFVLQLQHVRLTLWLVHVHLWIFVEKMKNKQMIKNTKTNQIVQPNNLASWCLKFEFETCYMINVRFLNSNLIPKNVT